MSPIGLGKKFVHVLILSTFVDRPVGLSQTRHLDGNRRNNALENLAWGTAKQNGEDRIVHGTGVGPMPLASPAAYVPRLFERPKGDERVRFAKFPLLDGYAVGTDGSIWTNYFKGPRLFGWHRRATSHACRKTHRRRTWLNPYERVGICRRRNKRLMFVHDVVLQTFVGPRPAGYVACHINGNCLDNRLANLRWATRKQNMADAAEHGTLRIGSKQPMAKLTEEKVQRIRQLFASGWNKSQLSKEFGVARQQIRRAINRETWRHVA